MIGSLAYEVINHTEKKRSLQLQQSRKSNKSDVQTADGIGHSQQQCAPTKEQQFIK